MSLSASDILMSEYRGALNRSACWNCNRRKECPYSYDHILEKSLNRAACQGEITAQRLRTAAERLLEEISGADHVCHLLCADEELERVLTDVLYAENTLMKSLYSFC